MYYIKLNNKARYIRHRLLLGILLLLKTDSSQYKFVIAVMLFNFQGIHIKRTSFNKISGLHGQDGRRSEFEASLHSNERASGFG